MKAHIKSSLSRVKAEDKLIEKTEKMLKCNYEKQSRERTGFARLRDMFSMRRPVMAAFAAVLTLCVFSAGGFSYYKTPVAYVSLDINPSVELSVNKFNRIVSATAYNDDGKIILEDKEIFNSSVKDAINELVKAASQKGYVKKDGSTIILVTSETGDSVTALTLGQEAEEGAKDAIKSVGDVAVVYKDSINLDKRNEAQQMGISPGKLNLIQKLQALDPNVTVDQYKAAEVTTIMKQIVAASSTDTSNTIASIQNIQNAVQQSQANTGSTGNNTITNNTTRTPKDSSIQVFSAKASGNDTITVTYSGEVGSSALNTDNYEVDGSSAFSKAVFTSSSKNAVKLTLENGVISSGTKAEPEEFTFDVSDILDAKGDYIKDASLSVMLYENVRPYVTKAIALDLTHINVTFNEYVMGNINKDDFAAYTVDGAQYRIISAERSATDATGRIWALTVEEVDPDKIVKAGTSEDFDGVDENGNEGIPNSVKTVRGLNY